MIRKIYAIALILLGAYAVYLSTGDPAIAYSGTVGVLLILSGLLLIKKSQPSRLRSWGIALVYVATPLMLVFLLYGATAAPGDLGAYLTSIFYFAVFFVIQLIGAILYAFSLRKK